MKVAATADVARPRRLGRGGESVSAERALAAIPDGSRVYVSGSASAPLGLVDAMVAERGRWTSLEILADYLLEPLALFDYPLEPFRLTTLQPSRAVDAMRAANALSTVPASLRHFATLTAPGAALELDAAIIQVSRPGPDGRFSLGTSVGIPVEMIANAPVVIAEVNLQMPYTFGAGELARDEIDFLVDVDHPLVELPSAAVDATSATIGELVAGLISDGVTIQFGIGAIPQAVLAALADHRDLGLHGGMFGDAVIDLVASGAMSGAKKSHWPGLMVVGAVIGTRRSFEFVDRNPDVLMVSSTISHGAVALGQLHKFHAINSAIEVALDGSINAEMVGDRVLSGPGGQPDYAIGAAESPGGRSIIALPATGNRGADSRIVAALGHGVTVTVHRSLADTVVTEYGVASLRGLSLDQRADALRSIAHPDFSRAL